MSLLRLKDIVVTCVGCGKLFPLAKMTQHILDEHSSKYPPLEDCLEYILNG
jgi:hypothetical protein